MSPPLDQVRAMERALADLAAEVRASRTARPTPILDQSTGPTYPIPQDQPAAQPSRVSDNVVTRYDASRWRPNPVPADTGPRPTGATPGRQSAVIHKNGPVGGLPPASDASDNQTSPAPPPTGWRALFGKFTAKLRWRR